MQTKMQLATGTFYNQLKTVLFDRARVGSTSE